MTNIIKPFVLDKLQTFYINVEGVGQFVIENPKNNGEKIFDRIVDSSTSHNLKCMDKQGFSIFINFVTQDDEEGKMLDADDVQILYRWLVLQPTEEKIIDEIVDEVSEELGCKTIQNK